MTHQEHIAFEKGYQAGQFSGALHVCNDLLDLLVQLQQHQHETTPTKLLGELYYFASNISQQALSAIKQESDKTKETT